VNWNIKDRQMLNKFVALSIVEVIYLTFSFAIAITYGQWSDEGETLRALARVVCLAIYSWFYIKFFRNPETSRSKVSLFRPAFLLSISLLMGFAIIDSNGINESIEWQRLFFISGIMAGFREELLYRGVVQNTLQKRYGYPIGLSISTMLFTMSHIQYMYYGQLNGLVLIACAGVIFGCVYIYTQSVFLTGFTHGLYDALLSVDFIAYKISFEVELPTLMVITLIHLVLVLKQLTGRQENRNH
jgi:membrane protease YdiL (CAAX protease family)